MIPILYEPSEKTFETNGLGALGDAISCLVTQERNGQYDLELQYPVTGRHYSEIKHERLILALPEDGAQAQPFEIYSISEPINGIVTILARHISYRLKELTVMPFTAENATEAMAAIQRGIVGEHPFTFWTDKTTVAKMTVSVPMACRSLLGGVQGSVLDVFGGGDYEFDRFAVRLLKSRGTDRGVVIQYGKNLTDSTRDSDIDGVYTSCVPFWRGSDGDTIVGDKVESGHAGEFAVQKCVPLDLSSEWQEKPDKAKLNERAQKYLADNTPWQPKVSVEISFIPLSRTMEYADIKTVEHVRLCDTVTVEARGFTAKAQVIRTVYNVLREMYDSVELGNARTSFGETVAQADGVTRSELEGAVQGVQSAIQDASDKLNDLIANSNGLYCTEQRQPDGSTIYLLHDKPALTESKNVIKLTSEAIGFSTDGGATYPYGFTVTGEWVARLLSAHGINADWINAGVIKSLNDDGQTFYLNLTDGVLKMKAQEFSVGGKTVDSIAQDKANAAQTAAQTYADTAASNALDTLTQQDVFNRLTNNGTNSGLYLFDGKLYINASYLASGQISADRIDTNNLSVGKLDSTENYYGDLYRIVAQGGYVSIGTGGNIRVQIFGTREYLGTGGAIRVFSGDVSGDVNSRPGDTATIYGDARATTILPRGIYVGQTSDDNYTGSVNCGELKTKSLVVDGATYTKLDLTVNGKSLRVLANK